MLTAGRDWRGTRGRGRWGARASQGRRSDRLEWRRRDEGEREGAERTQPRRASPLELLPSECWAEICAFLTLDEFARAGLGLSRTLRRMSLETMPLVRVQLPSSLPPREAGGEPRFLSRRRATWLLAQLPHWARNLEELDLCYAPIDESDLVLLESAHLPRLAALRLAGCEVTKAGARGLAKLPLRALALSRSRSFDDEALAALCDGAALRGSIEELDLAGCSSLSDAAAVALVRLSSLRALSLCDCVRISSATAHRLAELPRLASLDLRATQLCDVGLRALAALPLTSLDLRGASPSRPDALSEAGLAALFAPDARSAVGLASLSLSWFASDETMRLLAPLRARLAQLRLLRCSGVDGEGFDALDGAPQLRELDLSGCVNLEPRFMAPLASLRSLEVLSLHGASRLRDEALAPVAALTRLRVLDLSDIAALTDAVARILAALSSLEDLSLAATGVRDELLAALPAACPALRRLDLSGCRVSIAALRQAVARLGLLRRLEVLQSPLPASVSGSLRRGVEVLWGPEPCEYLTD